MKKTTRPLILSMTSLLLCITMLMGTTYAWFTESISSGVNRIISGNLDVELEYANAPDATYKSVENASDIFVAPAGEEKGLWEPGHAEVAYLKVINKGNLALKYSIQVAPSSETVGKNAEGKDIKLSEILKFAATEPASTAPAAFTRETAKASAAASSVKLTEYAKVGQLEANAVHYIALVVYMPETVGNEANYRGNDKPAIEFAVTLFATQTENEIDSFGKDYDNDAPLPKPIAKTELSTSVDVTNGEVTAEANMSGETAGATIPVGVKTEASQLKLTVEQMAETQSNVKLESNEVLTPVNVHIEGVAADNTVPMQIMLKEAAMKGLNAGNIKLYHVENGVTTAMTSIALDAQFTAHNQFKYDPATGDVVLNMATFSEVALVSDTENAWGGNFDYSWYTNAVAPVDGEAVTEYNIANADQLAAFGAIVGGMNGQTQDSFEGKTVKLLADVNLGDAEEKNTNLIFYPIGYYNSEGTYERTNTAITSGLKNFEGTFDGNGHIISNFYQNTWEMKGDNNYYDATLQYYRDGMGLFGKVYGGTVKNLTVSNFSSDGEFTTTGVIAAYADGATFENIAITNCNPRVYNTGNGGIVGCVGWYAKAAGLKTTFKNITVDNSNKISALWGSYDVACGGIVGQYYPTSGQTSAGTPKNAGIDFVNCHVSAIMDVYNDVCANYQYYAYRYTGMLIGSVRENETIDGHVYPKMDGITASGCTVHFGDWNDYYYCELVANSLASYTHDHQFSRLEQVAKVEGTTITPLKGESFTVPSSGRYNYVVVNGNHATENATCYHFVDGKVHNHDDYNGDGVEDYETVNGESIRVENNRHIYLEFNNLFTGYGWGVTSKGLTDYEGVENMDVTAGDHEASVEKFEGKVTELTNNREYKLGDIFAYLENCGVELVPGALAVGVTNLDENGNVSETIVYDRENWENSTITISGTGKARITIQDYYFCTPTTIEVTVTDRQSAEKFESKFTGDFLYRVGNKNAVELGTLFNGTNVTNDKVSISFNTVAGNTSGAFTANTTDWTKGTIQFSGTGVVKVTITDDDYCIPTELYLEVVDATNLTSATGTTSGGTFVLLCDVNTSTYVNYWNCTLFGNGFTYSLNGAPTAYNSKQGHGVLITQDAVLDNLVIIGDVYNTYGAYKDNECYNTAIDIQGSTIIQNCYIANCAAPIKARSDVKIVDTTLYGGTVANLIIMDGTVTLEKVITVNYADGRDHVGMGIVIHSDATDSAKLVLNGALTQYNFMSESKVPTDTYAKNLHDAMFSDSCSNYHFGTSPNRYVNTGIVSLTASFNADDITNNANTGYVGKAVTVGGVNGYVYTQPNTSGSVNNNYVAQNDKHKSSVQGDYLPTAEFDLGNQAVIGEDTYIKGDINGVEVRYIKGEKAPTLDITKLMTVYKYEDINYAVNADLKNSDGNSVSAANGVVTLNTDGNYTLVFTVEDDEFYNPDGTKMSKSVIRTYEVPLAVTIAEPAIKDAVITVNKTALDGGYNESYGDRSYKFNPLNAITITDAEGTVNLTTNIASTNIVYASSSSAFAGATTITVTYNDGRVLEMKLGKPSLNSPGSSKSITYANDGTIKSAAKVASKSATGGTWTVTSYSFKGTNGKTVTNNTVVTFTFPDKSCVTGDTLVMLADGTQKRIDQVTYEDQLLVWNFFTGEFDVVPSAIIFYHGDAEYDILNLKFSDGTVVKVINNHGFFDMEENQFVFIDAGNVEEYIGHRFAKVDGDNTVSVELVGYEITQEYTGCYSIQSAMHNNFMVEGMFSLTIPHYEGWFDYFEIGDGMKYDEEKMQADIAKYGLYTYEEFAEYVTYEQFIAFNGPYLKVLVGRGVVTYEQIIELISMYVNP